MIFRAIDDFFTRRRARRRLRDAERTARAVDALLIELLDDCEHYFYAEAPPPGLFAAIGCGYVQATATVVPRFSGQPGSYGLTDAGREAALNIIARRPSPLLFVRSE